MPKPVSDIDSLVTVLRRQLTERLRQRSSSKAPAGSTSPGQPLSSIEPLQALARLDGIDDRVRKRALVQHLLMTRMGAELANEPKFQDLVDQVLDTLLSEPKAAALMLRVLEGLRSAGA